MGAFVPSFKVLKNTASPLIFPLNGERVSVCATRCVLILKKALLCSVGQEQQDSVHRKHGE